MSEYDAAEIMDLACTAGKIIIENGGEVYRTEQTMMYICSAYGIAECQAYATPTTIIVSFVDQDEEAHTRMMRIKTRGVNLEHVTAVNNLSRQLTRESMPVKEARQALDSIATRHEFSMWQTILSSALGTAAFTIVFDGGLLEIGIGFILGALLRLLVITLQKLEFTDFFINMVGGAFASFGSWFVVLLGLTECWGVLTLSSLMLLVPGLLFINSLRDIAAGDLVSGLSRLIEALSIAGALAIGTVVMLMVLSVGGGSVIL